MVTLDQSTWNLLFSRVTGKQCFLPEGCSAPVSGIFAYLALAILVLVLVWKRHEIREKVSGLRG